MAHNASSNSLGMDFHTKHSIIDRIDKQETNRKESDEYPQISIKPSERNVSFQPSEGMNSIPRIATNKYVSP